MKLEVEANVPEQEFMEAILNLQSSGMEVLLLFVFYAFIKSWNINKFLYYKNLLEENEIKKIKFKEQELKK